MVMVTGIESWRCVYENTYVFAVLQIECWRKRPIRRPTSQQPKHHSVFFVSSQIQHDGFACSHHIRPTIIIMRINSVNTDEEQKAGWQHQQKIGSSQSQNLTVVITPRKGKGCPFLGFFWSGHHLTAINNKWNCSRRSTPCGEREIKRCIASKERTIDLMGSTVSRKLTFHPLMGTRKVAAKWGIITESEVITGLHICLTEMTPTPTLRLTFRTELIKSHRMFMDMDTHTPGWPWPIEIDWTWWPKMVSGGKFIHSSRGTWLLCHPITYQPHTKQTLSYPPPTPIWIHTPVAPAPAVAVTK